MPASPETHRLETHWLENQWWGKEVWSVIDELLKACVCKNSKGTQLRGAPHTFMTFSLSTTNWHLPRAVPRSEQQRHLPSASSELGPLQLLTFHNPQGVRGRVRCSVLQGIWWDRSLESWMFLETDFVISILASPHFYRSIESLHGDITSSWLTKPFCKMNVSWYWTSAPKPYILTFPHCHFGAVSQSYLRCCLLGCSPHFSPNKT